MAQVSCLWTPLSGCQGQGGRAMLLAEEPFAGRIKTGATLLSLGLLALSQPAVPALSAVPHPNFPLQRK